MNAVVPMIVVPDEGCGPAMAALNPAQRAFVYARVHFGCNNAEAARRAGYSRKHPGNAKITAYQLAQSEPIIAAMVEEGRKVLIGEGPRSIRTLVELRDDKTNEAKDRLKAAVELLNRGGLNAISESHLTVEYHHSQMSDAQLDQRILAMAAELGLPAEAARKLLISPADKKNSEIIDADFTEVETLSPEEQARRDHANEQRRKVRAMSPEERSAHIAAQRKQHSENLKAKRAAHEAQRLLAIGRDGLEDLLP